jgi:hypothetical protein
MFPPERYFLEGLSIKIQETRPANKRKFFFAAKRNPKNKRRKTRTEKLFDIPLGVGAKQSRPDPVRSGKDVKHAQ